MRLFRISRKESLQGLQISSVYPRWRLPVSRRVSAGSKPMISRSWSHPITRLHRLRLPERRLHKTIPRRPDNWPNIQILLGTRHPPQMPRHSRIPRTSPRRRDRARHRRVGKQHHESRCQLCDPFWTRWRMRGEVSKDEFIRDGFDMG